MCGILGQINRHSEIDRSVFERMLATLSKRGPDSRGILVEGKIALGHSRLKIIDLSERAGQPMSGSDGITLLFNGEIYNFQKLRRELELDFRFETASDTEVILNAYRKWGEAMLDKFEGMFALAVFDRKKQEILLARDHFGKKPLLYFFDGKTFCFASEIKSIISDPDISARVGLDEGSLEKFLFYGYIPSPVTIYKGIKKIPPGSFLKLDLGSWKILDPVEFWRPQKIQIKKRSENEALKRIDDLIGNALEKRLVSDVPLGIFFSGGVDSSFLSAKLAELSPQTEAFTLVYENYAEKERESARRIARKIRLKHTECVLAASSVKDNFLEMMEYLDEPFADAAIFPLHYLSKCAKGKITVALSGDGGDELFGGYPKHKVQRTLEEFSFMQSVLPWAKSFVGESGLYRKLLEGAGLKFAERQFIFGSGSFLPSEAANLLKERKLELGRIFSEALECDQKFKQSDVVNRSLFLDCRMLLPDGYLKKNDQAGMAASLEIRSPFLDKDLAEFVFGLSGGGKIKNGKSKYLLKKLAEKHLGGLAHLDKRGFPAPLQFWIRNELKDIFQAYLFLDNGFFDREYIGKMVQEHMDGKRDHQFKLMRVFAFNYWYANKFKKNGG